MYTGLLLLHSILRWLILILLFIVIVRVIVNNTEEDSKVNRKWSLRLLIVTHINFLIGLYQYFFGENGFALVKAHGMKSVMQIASLRFWVVEHISSMIVAVVLITVANSIAKKPIEAAKKNKRLAVIYIIALVIILVAIPWPFRGIGIGRGWI
jgi:hypothetical protein